MSSTGSRQQDNEPIVDEKVLFGINDLVNDLKIKESEIEKQSTQTLQNDQPKDNQLSHINSSHIDSSHIDSSHVNPPIDLFTPNNKDIDLVSNKSIKSRNSNWSKSSGKINENRNISTTLLDELLGETPANKSILPASVLYNDNQPIHQTDVDNFTRPLSVNHSVNEKSPEEELDEKIKLINQYEHLTKKIKDREFRQFGIHSSADDIRLEVRKLQHNRKREGATKAMRIGTIGIAKGIEQFFNLTPLFGIDINGFTTHLRHNIDDFDDIFEELYEKYSISGKSQPPEIRFLITFMTSLAAFVFANAAPKALFNYMSKNNDNSPPQQSYGEMSPPEMDDDIEEMIMDAKKRMEKK